MKKKLYDKKANLIRGIGIIILLSVGVIRIFTGKYPHWHPIAGIIGGSLLLIGGFLILIQR